MESERGIGVLLRAGSRVRDAHRGAVSMVLYGSVITLAYASAFFLRFELTWPSNISGAFLSTLPFLLILRLTSYRVLRLSTNRWRFISTQEVVRLIVGTSAGSALFFLFTWELGIPSTVPRSVIALEWVLTSYGIGGMWLAYRVLFEWLRHTGFVTGTPVKKVLLVGAGEAAAMLVREMARFPTGFRAVGMVDDDPAKWGTTIHGVLVLGAIDDLRLIARGQQAEEVIIAIPSAFPERLNEIVELCEKTELPFRLLPGMPEVLAGTAHLHQLRPVEIEDLLGREPIDLELPDLAVELQGKPVLVTGAAGSIGSELSFQIALHLPRKLILFDQAETPLVELERKLREDHPRLDLVPIVGDITDEPGLDQLFETHAPAQVFHAAAYKHVPIMEANPQEAVRNNVLGTFLVATKAGRWGAEKFVLVSTDKAVRPVNVMGATKRLAELLVLEVQDRFPATAFSAVRFGNVLGSSGSVIPLFKKQIEAGEPLTVTHKDTTRYFMTIPEAVQLILQASLLPNLRGKVAMLEMGEPVRILDLARKILRLSGSPGRVGREIRITGLRPGEKLEEELVAPHESTVETGIPRVLFVESNGGVRRGVLDAVGLWRERQVRDSKDPLAEFLPWVRELQSFKNAGSPDDSGRTSVGSRGPRADSSPFPTHPHTSPPAIGG